MVHLLLAVLHKHIWRLATYRVGGWWELSSLQRSFEMCGMISIGSASGGMDACSLVVRLGVCKFGRMVVRLLGCLLWLLLGSSVFACFLLCLCVCLAKFQCKEWQTRLSCRTPWRINMNSLPFVMASNWRQISGWLLLSNETYVFLHMQNSSAIPILRGSGACTPPTRRVACDRGGQEEAFPRLISLGRVRLDRPKVSAKPLEYVHVQCCMVFRAHLFRCTFIGFPCAMFSQTASYMRLVAAVVVLVVWLSS